MDRTAPELRIRTIEQLSTLKALRVLDQFTYGRLAAVAGVRAETVRSLFSRWEADGLKLLKEVGAEHAANVGQPPKIYTLAPGMDLVVERSIAAADHLSVSAIAANRDAVPVERLNMLDAAKDLLDLAEASEDRDRRGKLAAEAGRLLARSRAVLTQREVIGRGGAGESLKRELAEIERRLALLDPAKWLKFMVEERAAELEGGGAARSGASTQTWLTSLARLYFETGPSGRDAEVAFFAGFLAARGALGETQDTALDKWLREVKFADQDAKHDDATQLSWNALMGKFASAFARVVEFGSRNDSWHSLLQASLRGIAGNAMLAVVPALHEPVARLAGNAPGGSLREAAQSFLQRYCTSPALLKSSLAATAEAEDPKIDSYFVTQFRLSDQPPPEEIVRGPHGEDIDVRAFESDFSEPVPKAA
jgi:hypothetical protein